MKIPMPPPDTRKIFEDLAATNPGKLVDLFSLISSGQQATGPYMPWDKLRYRTSPEGVTHEEWWFAVKFARRSMQRELPLSDPSGENFTYALPDEILRGIETINREASGSIAISEEVTNPATRDRYIVSSLIEEAITSSQLEGASTTHHVAKEMLRSGRRARTRDEQMILNNYNAMRRTIELRDEKLTPEMICEIHRIVTDGTLDNPDASGRFQLPSEKRVGVYSFDNQMLHTPPIAELLPSRIESLCNFANGGNDKAYLPPILRAITLHFMIGYEHPFEDGNGRTARAIFYWSMLNQGYWLIEFLAISKILKSAPSKYARSFIYAEQDDNDLTYFHTYHLSVIQRAIDQLHQYLARKMQEVRDFQQSVALMPGQFNHRQLAILEHAVKSPGASYTNQSHSGSHNVSPETARLDLTDLERKGLLAKRRVGQTYVWSPVPGLAEKLREL
ncbi:MAG: Fic family protein [Actinomycetota bacterium]|nr:Fic family protein [Actinomycetota bacterium]